MCNFMDASKLNKGLMSSRVIYAVKTAEKNSKTVSVKGDV